MKRLRAQMNKEEYATKTMNIEDGSFCMWELDTEALWFTDKIFRSQTLKDQENKYQKPRAQNIFFISTQNPDISLIPSDTEE